MRIFILGCGYLGYNLSKFLKEEGHKVTVLGIESHYVPLCDHFEYVDVFNPQELATVDLKDAIVIDAVGLVANNAKSDDEVLLLEQLKEKYNCLLRALQKSEVKQFIYLSSGGTIYGESKEPINELFPIHPDTLYAKSKACIEDVIIQSGIDYLIIRLANPFGGYQEPFKRQGVVPILIRKVLANEPFEMWTDLENIRDYIYITDVSSAFSGLIQNRVNNEIVNVGSGIGTSLAHVIDVVQKYTGKEVSIVHQKSDLNVVESIVLDINKLKSLTGFRVSVSFEEGVCAEIERIQEEMKTL